MPLDRGAAFTEVKIVLLVRDLTKTLRLLESRDAAAYARASLAEARKTGPAALAAMLRGVMKSGRRYRAPRVQHVLEEDGRTLADAASIEAALERHFSIPEHGSSIPVQDLVCTGFATETDQPLDVTALPSIPDLAVGLQQLKRGKAPGASLLPAEAFSQAPLAAAMALFPVFLKGAIRRQVPMLWRGTQAIALLKPAKPAKCLASWRNIALFDCCAKGIGASIRTQLCRALQRISSKGQHGALKHSAIGVPSHYVQGYVRLARHVCRSGAIVFLDGKAAYYSIIREHLFPLDAKDDHTALQGLLASLGHDEHQSNAIVAAMTGPGILAEAGVPAALVEFLRDSLDRSWFALDVHKGVVQHTRTGSVPGTPTADVLFQFLQSIFMRNLTSQLRQAGLEAHYSAEGEGVPQPAWADDVAIMAPFCHAQHVVPAVRSIIRLAEAESRAGGIELNFSAGKTEVVTILRGKGSKAVRRDLLAVSEPSIMVPLASGGQAQVTAMSILAASSASVGAAWRTFAANLLRPTSCFGVSKPLSYATRAWKLRNGRCWCVAWCIPSSASGLVCGF